MSNAYSFGVVLVELLIGKKALCYERSERDRNLANHFLSFIEGELIISNLEDGTVNERNMEQIKEVAMLGKRCLNVKGKDRATMKEVAAELGVRLLTKHSWVPTPSEEAQTLLEVPLQPHEYIDVNLKTAVYEYIGIAWDFVSASRIV